MPSTRRFCRCRDTRSRRIARWRSFGATAVAAYSALLLAACDGERQASDARGVAESERRTIVFAHTTTMGDVRRLMDELESDFERSHPGVDVRQIVMDDDDYQKFGLLNLFTGNSSPDAYFQWGGYLVRRDARAGFARDLRPFLDRDDYRAHFVPERWFGGDIDGRSFLLPQTVSVTVVLFYNRAVFARHGLEPPASWDELLSICERLRDAGVTPIVAGNKDLWMVGNWAAHIASRVVGEDEYRRTFSLETGHRFDTDGWRSALARLERLVRMGALNPGAVSMTDDEAMAEFVAGRAAMIPNGDWLVPEIIKARAHGANIEHGFFNTPPIPGGLGDQGSVMAVCNGYAMGARARDPELTWEFLREFLRVERQRKWVEQGIISPVAGVETGDAMKEVEDVVELLKQAKRTVSPPDTGYEPTAWMAFYDAVQQVLAGNRRPAEALSEAERAIAVFRPRS